MWIVVSYDFPSDRPALYRRFRKTLLKCGFSFAQKSLCWRWAHSHEKAESLRRTVEKELRAGGCALCWLLPDRVFAAAACWNKASPVEMPSPPEPWLIV